MSRMPDLRPYACTYATNMLYTYVHTHTLEAIRTNICTDLPVGTPRVNCYVPERPHTYTQSLTPHSQYQTDDRQTHKHRNTPKPTSANRVAKLLVGTLIHTYITPHTPTKTDVQPHTGTHKQAELLYTLSKMRSPSETRKRMRCGTHAHTYAGRDPETDTNAGCEIYTNKQADKHTHVHAHNRLQTGTRQVAIRCGGATN